MRPRPRWRGRDQAFSSPRCRDVDLGNWFLDRYRVSRVLNPEEDLEELQAALESDEEEGLAG